MKKEISKRNIIILFLVAIVVILIAVFVGALLRSAQMPVSEDPSSTLTSPAAAIFSQLENTQQQDSNTAAPLVTLISTPATANNGDAVTISWSVTGSVATCTASSNPADTAWSGAKQASEGTHVQLLTAQGVDTTYSIECVGVNGRTSASSMTVLGG